MLHRGDLAHGRARPRVDVDHHEGPLGAHHAELLQEGLPLEVIALRVVVEGALPHRREPVVAVVVAVLLLRVAIVGLAPGPLGERELVVVALGVAGLQQAQGGLAAHVLDLLDRDQIVATHDGGEGRHHLRLARLRGPEDLDVEGRHSQLDRRGLGRDDRRLVHRRSGGCRGRGSRRRGRAPEEQEQP